MLQTNIDEVLTAKELEDLIKSNEKVAVCCGRMGPMCIPVYDTFEILQDEYTDIKFRSMAFDSSESNIIRNLPECRGFNGLPFTVYYRNGKVVKATTSIQTSKQIKDIINEHLA
jgi:thioredoxin 1